MFQPVRFGKYHLTRRLAVGGMAEIFLAKLTGESGFEKPMVVKQILPQFARNSEFIRMFVDEAKIAVHLTHGNIVPVYELGRINDTYFIAMEYVPGHDLAATLEQARAKDRRIPIELAVFICIELCNGLDHAHRRMDAQGRPLGVVHRDVSPPNVLTSMEGQVKITDFGVAKAAMKLGTTEAGVVKGTYGYMSPEQVRGLPVDHRTDIFSTGILLYEILTGRRLFVGANDIESLERVKNARVSPPSAVYADIPASLDGIVLKALSREANERHESASSLSLELSRFLYQGGAGGLGANAASLAGFMHELFAADRTALPRDDQEILFSALDPPAVHAELRADHLPESEAKHAEFEEDSETAKAGPQLLDALRRCSSDVLRLPNLAQSDDTQSYAVRPEFEEATGAAPRPMGSRPRAAANGAAPSLARAAAPVDVALKASAPLNATLALPSINPPPPAPLPSAMPQQPAVPKLRFDDDPEPPRGGAATSSARPRERDAGLLSPVVTGTIVTQNAEAVPARTRPSRELELPSADELALLADSLEELGPPPPAVAADRASSPTASPAAAALTGRPLTARATGASNGRGAAAASTQLPEERTPPPARDPVAELRAFGAASLAMAVEPSTVIAASEPAQPPTLATDETLLSASEKSPREDATTPYAGRRPTPVPPAPEAPASGPERVRRKSKISDMLSHTMRLFVQGGGEDEAPSLPIDRLPPQSELDSSPALFASESSAAVSAVKDETGAKQSLQSGRLKPTVLGWLAIALLVIGSGGFVAYKKTSLFRSDAAVEDDSALLSARDIRRTQPEPEVRYGTITLDSTPDGASFFLYVGETPVTVENQVDAAASTVFRVERDGFRTVDQTVTPKDFVDDEVAGRLAQVQVALDPLGAGAAVSPPEVAAEVGDGEIAEPGKIVINSTPPKAMVWRLMGRGPGLSLTKLDTRKGYYFKALLPAHKPSFVRVSAVDFEGEVEPTFSSTVKLEADTESGERPSAVAARPGPPASSAAAPESPGSAVPSTAGVVAQAPDAPVGDKSTTSTAAAQSPQRRKVHPAPLVHRRTSTPPRKKPAQKTPAAEKKPAASPGSIKAPSWAD